MEKCAVTPSHHGEDAHGHSAAWLGVWSCCEPFALQSSTAAAALLNSCSGRESHGFLNPTKTLPWPHQRGHGLCSAPGEAEIPPCPQQINNLIKSISSGKCHLIVRSICSTGFCRSGCVTSACALWRFHPLMSIIYFISERLRNNQYSAFLSFLEVQSKVNQGQTAPLCSSQPHHSQAWGRRQRAATASSQIPCVNRVGNKIGKCRLLTVLQMRLQQGPRASDGATKP